MKIRKNGLLNTDQVCAVPHFMRLGESLVCSASTVFADGKGFNQSLALARAGAGYGDAAGMRHQPATVVPAIDTTAAGDTFIGCFSAALMRADDPAGALAVGCRVVAFRATRTGESISCGHAVVAFVPDHAGGA